MNNISKFKNCYGCSVCAVVCPCNIIQIRKDKHGFYQPFIDNKSDCINCGLCLKVCSYNNALIPANNKINSYASWSLNSDLRHNASSGGTCYELAKDLLNQDFKVIGVKYNLEKQIAEHFIASNEESLKETIGSKYIQSYAFNAFKEIKRGNKYVIIGTPCQIASIKQYVKLKHLDDNVILIDFFCHGVPSILMWEKYLKENVKQNVRITNVSWRNKSSGWHDSWGITFDGYKNDCCEKNDKLSNGIWHQETKWSQGDLFYRFFLGNFCLNKACYKNCKFKGLNSAADIRIGDLWGENYRNDDKGVTGLITFSDKGLKTVQENKFIYTKPESYDIVTQGQLKKVIQQPYFYNFVLLLLRTPLRLSFIYRIIQILNINIILKYKLRVK